MPSFSHFTQVMVNGFFGFSHGRSVQTAFKLYSYIVQFSLLPIYVNFTILLLFYVFVQSIFAFTGYLLVTSILLVS